MKDEDIAKNVLFNSINSLYGADLKPIKFLNSENISFKALEIGISKNSRMYSSELIQKSIDDFWKTSFKNTHPKPDDITEEEYAEFIDKLIETRNKIKED